MEAVFTLRLIIVKKEGATVVL